MKINERSLLWLLCVRLNCFKDLDDPQISYSLTWNGIASPVLRNALSRFAAEFISATLTMDASVRLIRWVKTCTIFIKCTEGKIASNKSLQSGSPSQKFLMGMQSGIELRVRFVSHWNSDGRQSIIGVEMEVVQFISSLLSSPLILASKQSSISSQRKDFGIQTPVLQRNERARSHFLKFGSQQFLGN